MNNCKYKKDCIFWNKSLELCSRSICKYGLDNRKLPKQKKKESWIKQQFKESWNTAKNILFGFD